MDVAKLARKVDLSAMELRGYLTHLEKLSVEVESYARKCERELERASKLQDRDEISPKITMLWEEAFELLVEAMTEIPSLIQGMEDVLSGIENAPTSLNEIAQISAAKALANHDERMASRSAFNR